VRIVRLLRDGRHQVTGFLHEGDFLGLTDGGNYVYTAEAISDATLCRFPRARLENLFARYPALENCLLGMAVTEIAAAHDQVLLLGRKTVRERAATLLIMLSRRTVGRGRPESPVNLPMSREDIADYLGLTLETVSRTFNTLRREGYIDFTRRGRATDLRIDRLAGLTGD
jgi:CRP/FNR family transcriptional regulator